MLHKQIMSTILTNQIIQKKQNNVVPYKQIVNTILIHQTNKLWKLSWFIKQRKKSKYITLCFTNKLWALSWFTKQ